MPIVKLSVRENIALIINLITGLTTTIIMPTDMSFFAKLLTILVFLATCYFSFVFLTNNLKKSNSWIEKIFLIFVWCIAVSAITIFSSMLIIGLFLMPEYDYNILDQIGFAITSTFLGLFFTRHIWGSLFIVNLLLLLKKSRAKE